MPEEKKLATVRSFVRRQGRITPKQKNSVEKLWPIFGLTLEKELMDFPTIFGNSNPLIVEIGFGMGHALLQMAKENPEQNFIGIEVHKPGVGALLAGIEKENLKNIRIFSEDAKEVLDFCIAENSLAKILILFPDPWPKKRHHKRRLVTAEFLEKIIPKLKMGGILHLATDWKEYAEQMLEAVSAQSNLSNKEFAKEHHRPSTKFEKRGQNLGHEIWDIIAIRSSR